MALETIIVVFNIFDFRNVSFLPILLEKNTINKSTKRKICLNTDAKNIFFLFMAINKQIAD